MIDKNLVAAPGSPDRALLDALDLTRLPRHVAVIMDGNGRWAKQRHLPRVEGHRAGAAAVRDTVETAARLGLDALTLYAFSTENWKRPKTEVSTLFTLLKEYLRRELKNPRRERHPLPRRGAARRARRVRPVRARPGAQATAGCRGMVFSVALNYSGRAEITDAVRSLAREAAAGRLDPESIDEAAVARRLYTADLPDPDLLIRTSGEMRISNFLLWQIAYAEIHVTPVLWPDFRCRHFLEALVEYQRRERRYGGVSEADESAEAAAGGLAARTALEA